MSDPAFTCPRCGMTSHNPGDLTAGYCGNCHDWTGTPDGTTPVGAERVDVAIEAAADALLAVCALQTGLDPTAAYRRALDAVTDVLARTEREAHGL